MTGVYEIRPSTARCSEPSESTSRPCKPCKRVRKTTRELGPMYIHPDTRCLITSLPPLPVVSLAFARTPSVVDFTKPPLPNRNMYAPLKSSSSKIPNRAIKTQGAGRKELGALV